MTDTSSLPSLSAASRERLQHVLAAEGSEQLAAILQRPRPEGFTLLDEIQLLGAASSFGRWADDIELLNTLKSVLFDDELNALRDSAERVTRSADSPTLAAGPEYELAKAAFDIAQSHQRESHSPSVRTERIDRSLGDYPRLLNTLRARIRDVKTGTCATDRVFVAVAEDSPLFAGVAFGGSILQQFKTLLRGIAGVDPAGDVDADLLPGGTP